MSGKSEYKINFDSLHSCQTEDGYSLQLVDYTHIIALCFSGERSKNRWYGTGFRTFQEKGKKETDFPLIFQPGESAIFGRFRNLLEINQLQGYSYQTLVFENETWSERQDVIWNACLGKWVGTGVYLFFPDYVSKYHDPKIRIGDYFRIRCLTPGARFVILE